MDATHSHVFLGVGHEANERRSWAVIVLCGVMMVAEIAGGLLFGSIALVADGLHMSTHAGALLLAALAYSYARRHAQDARFSFGTGKLGDLAGFSSAIVLLMIAVLIGYEAVRRFIEPVPIHFREAIPIAALGLVVNVVSAWLLGAGHDHAHGHHHEHDDEGHRIPLEKGALRLEIFEQGVPPRFRLYFDGGAALGQVTVETLRPNGAAQVFELRERIGYLESDADIPEPHEFVARIRLEHDGVARQHDVIFAEHAHAAAHRDNNMRAAVVHVMADATVSLLVIVGLVLAKLFGWLWMDPLAGLIGAGVIVTWSWTLVRDTGAVLLDMMPDRNIARHIQNVVEAGGDRVTDLHVWRLGPGHLGAIVAVETTASREPGYYRERLAGLAAVSHLTVEVRHGGKQDEPQRHLWPPVMAGEGPPSTTLRRVATESRGCRPPSA